MEDVLAYNLTKRQVIQILSIQLYLQVNLLSKITDHQGTHILPMMLDAALHAQHTQYYWQNHSTLQWP